MKQRIDKVSPEARFTVDGWFSMKWERSTPDEGGYWIRTVNEKPRNNIWIPADTMVEVVEDIVIKKTRNVGPSMPSSKLLMSDPEEYNIERSYQQIVDDIISTPDPLNGKTESEVMKEWVKQEQTKKYIQSDWQYWYPWFQEENKRRENEK